MKKNLFDRRTCLAGAAIVIAVLLFVRPSLVRVASAQDANANKKTNTNASAPKKTPAKKPVAKKPTPKKSPTANSNTSNAANAAADERTYWESIRNSTDPADFRAYLREYPNGKYVTLATNRLNSLEVAARATAAEEERKRKAAAAAEEERKRQAATTTSRPVQSKPVVIQINTRVRGDSTSNGWTTSGYSVRRGQRIRITATGQVSLGNGRFSQPSGISTLSDKDKLMPDEPTGALLCVVGDDNNDFIFIGRARDFVAQRDGVLFLGINEGNLNDNTGAYDALIEAEAAGEGR